METLTCSEFTCCAPCGAPETPLVSERARPSAEPPAPSVDLIEASYRSDSFPTDWTRPARETALLRYRKWLGLKQRHANAPLAPTRDIDLFWHLHMLSPVAYYRDCQRLFGRLVDHDGGFGKGPGELAILKQVFLATEARWEAAYGEAYLVDGTFARDAALTDCWHDCADRCWHACNEVA